MSSKTAAELFAKGKDALVNDHTYLARVCFENALNEERTPAHRAYFALALAKSRGDFVRAIKLAEESLAAEPGNSEHYLIMGKILILAGRRQEALAILRSGAQIDRNPEILRELDSLGTRGKPVLASLPRSHPLNKILGILFARLGLRQHAPIQDEQALKH
jgi:tetratricopeptide (TPR) repeat protein